MTIGWISSTNHSMNKIRKGKGERTTLDYKTEETKQANAIYGVDLVWIFIQRPTIKNMLLR